MSEVNEDFIKMQGFVGLDLDYLLLHILISIDFWGIILRVWLVVVVGDVVGVGGFNMGLIAFMGDLSVLRVITFG